MKFLLNTTSTNNQSGFSTIGNQLTQILFLPESEAALYGPVIEKLTTAFAESYKTPSLSLAQLRQIFSHFLHPEDQQVLWVEPLKKILNKAQINATLSAEEMSSLCEKLHLSFQVLDNGFNTMNNSPKGYQGKAPLGTVETVQANHHWQAITHNMSDAYRQQLLWKQGVRQLSGLHSDAVALAVKEVLSFPAQRFTSPILVRFIFENSHIHLAERCKLQADTANPDNGFFNMIDDALENKDIATLLTIYYFKPNSRNYILTKGLATHSASFIADFLKSFHALPSPSIETADWESQLRKVLPCIAQKSGDSELHQAIRARDVDLVKKLILDGADIYQANTHGVSPLHLACANEDRPIVKAMIENETAKNKRNTSWRRFFFRGVDLTRPDASGQTPWHYAAACKDSAFAELLFGQEGHTFNPDILFDQVDHQGRSAIHLAAVNEKPEVLKAFLRYKSHQISGHNVQDSNGLTPLHYAVAEQNVENVKLLLAAGASCAKSAYKDKVKAKFPHFRSDLSYLTPLWLALELNDLNMAALLITNANHLWNTKNSQGLNAVQLAAQQGRVDLLKAWDQKYPSSNLLISDGEHGLRLIHHAAIGGHLAVVKFLYERNERLSRIDPSWNTALHFAAQNGHVEIVRFICAQSQEEKQYNAALTIEGGIKNILLRKRVLIDIDSDNDFGETPYALALIHGHDEVVEVLKKAGAKPVSLTHHLLNMIYNIGPLDKGASESRAANIVAKHSHLVLKNGPNQDTLIHHAIKAGNYRALQILLHPLTVAERNVVANQTGQDGLSPLGLIIKQRFEKLSTKQTEQLDKIERALICYNKVAFQKKYRTLAQKARYQIECAQDLKSEMEASTVYYYASLASLYGESVYYGFTAFLGTLNPLTFAFKAFETFLSGDTLDKAERSLSMTAKHFPDFLPGYVFAGSVMLQGFGLYRHTTKRLTTMAMKHSSALIMSLAAFDQKGFASKNYFTHMNMLGFAYACSEELGRRVVAEYLSHYWSGIEETAVQYGVPKLNDVAQNVVEAANQSVKQVTGVDVTRSLNTGYNWFRENVGSLQSAGTQLLAQLDEEVMSNLAIADLSQRDMVKQLIKAVIEDARYDDVKLSTSLDSLLHYVHTGEQTEQFVQLLTETATHMSEKGADFGEVCAQVILAAPFYQADHFTDEQRAKLLAEVRGNVMKDRANLQQVMSTVARSGISLLGKQFVEANCLPLLTTKNQTTLDYVNDSVSALYAKSLENPIEFTQDWTGLTLYLNKGVVTLSVAKALDNVANALVAQGHQYEEVITNLAMSNHYYQLFNFDPILHAGFAQHLKQNVQALAAASPEARAYQLEKVLDQERQYAVDSYVQTLKAGQVTANDYKNILDQSHIKYCSDGLSEYAAQILVFENPLFFCQLSHAQKCQMQDFFRAYFNEMQHSANKMNENAVVVNFDRVKTFIICSFYTDLVLSGANVGESIPTIFSQLDARTVRAAMAAHQMAAMLEKATGYKPLTVPETFVLFRKFFDQQFDLKSNKIEQGFIDVVNETFRKQDQTGGQFESVWGYQTLDETAQFIAQTSRNIAENRWQGTGDAFARQIEHEHRGKIHRYFASVEKNIRHAVLSGNVGIGLVSDGTTHTPALVHVPTGTMLPIPNPFAKVNKTISLPKGLLTSGGPANTALVPLPPPADIVERTPIYTPLLAANEAERTAIYTPLLAANDAPRGKVAPAWLPATSTLRTKPAPIDFNEMFVSPLAKHKDIAFVAELESGLLLQEVGEVVRLLPVVQPEPSLGERIVDLVIGNAHANPAVLAGLSAAGAEAAGAVGMQASLASLNAQRDDYAAEYNAALNLSESSVYVTSFPLMVAQSGLGLFKKSGANDKPRPNAPDPDKRYVPAPKELPGFPEAKKDREKTPFPGGLRKRWKLPDGKILEWDKQHGEAELYDKQGNHLGAYDPNTGVQLKGPKNDRNIKKFL